MWGWEKDKVGSLVLALSPFLGVASSIFENKKKRSLCNFILKIAFLVNSKKNKAQNEWNKNWKLENLF